MSAVHNALRRGPFNNMLTRFLGLSREDEGLERVGETLTPIINLWDMPEAAYLRREYLLCFPFVVGAVVGEYGTMGLVNPAGSGFLLVVENVACRYGAGAGTFSLQRVTEAAVVGTLAAQSRGFARDTRCANANLFPGVGVVYTGTDAGAIGLPLEYINTEAANAFRSFSLSLPLVIHPAYAMVVQFGAQNLAAEFCFSWRERKALPGELE